MPFEFAIVSDRSVTTSDPDAMFSCNAAGGDAQQATASAVAVALSNGGGQATAVAVAISIAIQTYGCSNVQPTISSKFSAATQAMWLFFDTMPYCRSSFTAYSSHRIMICTGCNRHLSSFCSSLRVPTLFRASATSLQCVHAFSILQCTNQDFLHVCSWLFAVWKRLY